MKLTLSFQASTDLEEIFIYGLTNYGSDQSVSYLDSIYNALSLITTNPSIGRIDALVSPAIHRFETGAHVVFYDIRLEEIYISRILHNKTDYIHHL